MSTCDMCGKASDLLVPMLVDLGGSPFDPPAEEEWCPECVADLVVDEFTGLDESEAAS
ncbi:hypothetical protein JNB62_05475 [Microbacterium jejuense]|uniref:Cysteine-rich CPXCG n=1 Tax=Microbacterium jejuense TaxID=1263637 RepID=A0ABS7HJJ1_9MICO|nr:hypothetical protein [Microbacterium jejuense]MBW9093126.1 hypothetical protein [Microbacterium jejuense]